MTDELYKEVKDEIPKHIGVYVRQRLVKRPKKQELLVDDQILKDSMIRSLYREASKVMKSKNPTIVESLKRQLNTANKERDDWKQNYWKLLRIGREKYGTRWNIEND